MPIRRKRLFRRNELPFKYQSSTLRNFIDSRPHYFFFKRVFDLSFSMLVIFFILSWFIPLMALIIKMGSRGSVFFLQRRIGRGGKAFVCVKLRTMMENWEADTHQAIKNGHP